MLFYGEKPNYVREQLREDLKETFRVKKYDTIEISKFFDWINNLIKQYSNKEIKLEFISEEESDGFNYPDTYIEINPYYLRFETDAEYSKRISEEEEEYNKYLEAEKLRKEKHEQYLKDMEEYKRIKKKYNI